MRKIARRLYRAIPFKQPAFEVLRRIVSVPEPVYRHLHFRGVIEVPVGDTTFRMKHHGYQIENEVFWSGLFGRWEGPSLRMWVHAARQARAILDVGANTGLYALAAQAVAPRASVGAVEPVARVRARLQANVDLNGSRIRVLPMALSDRDGTGVMLDTEEENELSVTLEASWDAAGARSRREVPVTLARLDTLVASGVVPAPDLLKIDVEGHESAVLRGMSEQLERTRPTLLMEVITAAAAARVGALLGPFGYLVYRLDEAGPRRLAQVEPAPGSNLLLCAPDAARRLVADPGNTTAPAA